MYDTTKIFKTVAKKENKTAAKKEKKEKKAKKDAGAKVFMNPKTDLYSVLSLYYLSFNRRT